jgi:penicillin-binding protein 1A
MSHAQRTRRRRRASGGGRSKAFLAFMVLGIVVVIAGLGGVGYVVHIAASAPPLSSLKARAIAENSRVYAADGTSLGFIQNDELHLPLKRSDIPQIVRDSTIAIEDERFYDHNGVDYEGVVRAAVTNLQSENEHSKEWILERYLDSIPYGTVGGQSAIGIKAAAKIYFSKDLKDLNLREAALLAGIPQATDTYSPVRNRGAAKTRRNEVLQKMAELGMVTQEQADAAARKGLGVNTSQYFTRRREHYFFDYVKDQLFREYGAQTVRSGGLKVYTTIDLRKQEEARATIERHLAGVGPSSAIVTIDPRTGYIEAMASSGDYGESNFNLAAQGHRRPGSTFKVMALMTALRMGVDPDSTSYTSRSPTVLDDPAYGHIDIKTYSGTGGGTMTLRRGTLQSDNSVYIQLALDLGPDEVAQTAKDMGIRSTLKGYPAETLGGLENGVSPLEMATAYASVANGGLRVRPTAITKIKFPDGRVEKGDSLPPRFRVKRTRIFSDGVAAKATEILKQNLTGGTGGRAYAYMSQCPAAGKTGTVDDNTDAWFVGYTPRMATSVWVGYPDDELVSMSYQFFGGPVDGGTFPAQIWGDYMNRVKGSYCGDFAPPEEPFVSSPFFGRYANSGGKHLEGGDEGTTTETTETTDPVTDTAEEPEPATGETSPETEPNNGFDPGAYEAPPQGEPETEAPANPDAGEGGGVVAPPG